MINEINAQITFMDGQVTTVILTPELTNGQGFINPTHQGIFYKQGKAQCFSPYYAIYKIVILND